MDLRLGGYPTTYMKETVLAEIQEGEVNWISKSFSKIS